LDESGWLWQNAVTAFDKTGYSLECGKHSSLEKTMSSKCSSKIPAKHWTMRHKTINNKQDILRKYVILKTLKPLRKGFLFYTAGIWLLCCRYSYKWQIIILISFGLAHQKTTSGKTRNPPALNTHCNIPITLRILKLNNVFLPQNFLCFIFQKEPCPWSDYSLRSVAYRGGFQPPPPEILKFWQCWAGFPVPWKKHP
jgi:hypothetical protein